MLYDMTLISLRPATLPRAMERLKETAPAAPGKFLACWQTDVGALNQVLLLRQYDSEQQACEHRTAMMRSTDPYGVGEFTNSSVSDTFELLPFLPPLQPGSYGPFFEVRTYLQKPGVATANIERWEKALPERNKRSQVLCAMHSTSGVMTRFIHIWPYKSMDERYAVRTQAQKDGIWPPPGGGQATLLMQQNDIYVPASFSPIK